MVKEFTWAEGPVHPAHCPLWSKAGVFTLVPFVILGSGEKDVSSGAHEMCGTWGGEEGTELHVNKEV